MKGMLRAFGKDESGEYTKLLVETNNLWVDDGKELTLDFLFGIKSWWNPLDQGDYGSGNIGWDVHRYVGFGECMFNNSSFERASGIYGVPSGEELNFPVATTFLVSPEDSFLSAEIGNRVEVECTRRDQIVELSTLVHIPSDIPASENMREFAIFLQDNGPTHDPSLLDSNKPKSIICRASLYGTGWYNSGGPCSEYDNDAILCYYDSPYVTIGDIKLMWLFGEL